MDGTIPEQKKVIVNEEVACKRIINCTNAVLRCTGKFFSIKSVKKIGKGSRFIVTTINIV